MLRKVFIWLLISACAAQEDNPFQGIDSIKIFSAADVEHIQDSLDTMLPIPKTVGGKRLAVFLESGDYGSTDLHLGYFTSVAGLGVRPSDVKVGHVRIDTVGSDRGDTTTIFWRSVENMETRMTTSCSQGIAFRRILSSSFIHDNTTDAAGNGGGSGGFIADCLVKDGHGDNFAAGGQQYFVRNTQANHLECLTQNTLFLGCKGQYGAQAPEVAYIDKTPAIAEKPYITKNATGTWSLVKPKVQYNVQGPSFDENGDPTGNHAEYIDFSQVFIAREGTTAKEINRQIAAGKHIILSPYVYHLEDSILLNRSGTVFLGLGLATLECAANRPCLVVGAVDDVRVAGVTVVGAEQSKNEAWVQIGDPSNLYKGNASKPSIMSDNHIIVGYYRNNSVRATVQVNNGQVIIDHSWSWRSDIDGAHGESRNGFEVHGENVTAYGLFSEHHWQYSLAWYGNFGKSYFFQCETPWDAGKGALQNWSAPEGPNNTWRHWPSPNWYTIQPRCYYVDDKVENFFGVSVGAYSMEGGGCSSWCGCQETEVLDTHIQIPNAPGVALLRATCWKNCGGGVNHCINSGQPDSNWMIHTNWCNGKEVPYLGMNGNYTEAGIVSLEDCATSVKNTCADYASFGDGCRWTNDYSCPDQPQGTSGKADDDNSMGYECCCSEGFWHKCGDYMAERGCGWTQVYNCPDQSAGSHGQAEDNGNLGYECCCRQHYWKDMANGTSIVV